MERENLNREEQSMLALHDPILSAFREHFGEEAIIEVKLMPLAHECWITVLVRQRTEEMLDLADELEWDFREELGRHITIFVKRPWKVALGQLPRKIVSPLPMH